MTPAIIGIAGKTASGKTTVAKHLERKHGAYRTKYSDYLIEYAKAEGRPTTKAELQNISTHLRQTEGEDFLTKKLRERLKEVDVPLIVVEGNRRVVDIEFLTDLAEELGRELVLIFVDADVEERYRRYKAREGEAGMSFDAFMELENDECENELQIVKDMVEERGTVIDSTHVDESALCALAEEAALAALTP